MKCLILAAGYATRLYPLTKNFPKPLLEVGDKTILDRLVDDIDTANVIDEYIVISNHVFYGIFLKWAESKSMKIRVLDDGTDSNETRLGAVKDVLFALTELNCREDVLVIAGDNLLDFSLTKFISYALEKKSPCILRYYEPDDEKLKRSGVVTLGESDEVLRMDEKPAQPVSHWCTPPFYYYTAEAASLIESGIRAGCGTDAPGSFISWLCAQTKVYAMEMPGKRYDIGNLESYNEARNNYKGII